MGGSFDDLGPPALRSHVLTAILQACTEELEAASMEVATAAYLLRGRVAAALGDRDAALKDFKAAVASQDSTVMYDAAAEIVKLSPAVDGSTAVPRPASGRPDRHELAERAVRGLHGIEKAPYTRLLHKWFRNWHSADESILHASPDAIAGWLRDHSQWTRALPAFERFYAEAEAVGYPNPMPEARQLLGLVSSPRVARQDDTQLAAGDVVT